MTEGAQAPEQEVEMLEQGESYEEEDFNEDIEDEGSEDTESPEIATFYGIPKQYVYIALIVLVLIIVILIVIKISKKNKEADYVDTGETIEYYEPSDFGDVGSDYYYDDTYTDTTNFDMSTVLEPEDLPEATIADISEEDMVTLRSAGYTGDEIELALKYGFPVEDLLEAAKDQQDQFSIESLKRMSDHASDEFRYIVSNTYFSQPYVKFKNQYDKIETWDDLKVETDSFTRNCDYIKCPTYGEQLYLKVKLNEGEYGWMQINPERWAELPNNGNIVVTVKYSIFGNNKYIIDLQEAGQYESVETYGEQGSIYDDGSTGGGIVEKEKEAELKAQEEKIQEDKERALQEVEDAKKAAEEELQRQNEELEKLRQEGTTTEMQTEVKPQR